MSQPKLFPPAQKAICARIAGSKLCKLAEWRELQQELCRGNCDRSSVRPGRSAGAGERTGHLDRVIDQGVTSVITQVGPEHARELLACLKFIIDLERIGDLLLNCSNRAAAVGSRIELQDIRDLTVMASRLEKMLGDVHDAFSQRDLNRALAVLRSDAELDVCAIDISQTFGKS